MSETDHVRMWKNGNTLGIWGASWAFNPKVTQDDFLGAYQDNPVMADRDYAAIPPETSENALRSTQVVEQLHNKERISPVNENGSFADWFKGSPEYEYYLHIDMSKVTDATGMGMAHYNFNTDHIVVDLIHTLVSSRDWELSFERVFQLIIELQNRGFKFAKVTFDTWQSYQMVERLQNAGIPSEFYSVDRGTEAYDTLISTMLQKRLDYYFQAVFVKELKNLKLISGQKYDHPKVNEDGTRGSKDTADGVAGAVAQCSKALMGLTLKESEILKVATEKSLAPVEMDPGTGLYWVPPLRETPMHVRVVPRTTRMDAYEEVLIVMSGWNDLKEKKLRLDQVYVWENYDQPNMLKNVQETLFTLFTTFKMESWSLNENVPPELILFLQENGRRVTSALSVGSRQALIRTGPLQKRSIRLLLNMIKQGNIAFVNHGSLSKDLQYMTQDNMLERKYVSCLAGWVDFTSKEASFGTGIRPMPRIMKASVPSVVAAGIGQMPSNAVGKTGAPVDSDIQKIREKYFRSTHAGAGQPAGTPSPQPQGPNTGRRFPRIRSR